MTTTLLSVKNNAATTLAEALDNSETGVDVADASVFPGDSDCPFHISIDEEILEVTGVSSNTLTVATRGTIEDTDAATHDNGSVVYMNVTAQYISDLNTAVNNLEDSVFPTVSALVVSSTAPANFKDACTEAATICGNDSIQVCSGADDHVEIIAAYALSNSVVLSEGTFYCEGDITPPAGSTLRGMGEKTTILDFVATSKIILSNDNLELSDFKITGDPSLYAAVFITGSHIKLHDIWADDLGNSAISVFQLYANSSTVEDIEFVNIRVIDCDRTGFYVIGEGSPKLIKNVRWTNCQAINCGRYARYSAYMDGFALQETGDIEDFTLIFCLAERNWEIGFAMEAVGTKKRIVEIGCISRENGIDKAGSAEQGLGFGVIGDTTLLGCKSYANQLVGFGVLSGKLIDCEDLESEIGYSLSDCDGVEIYNSITKDATKYAVYGVSSKNVTARNFRIETPASDTADNIILGTPTYPIENCDINLIAKIDAGTVALNFSGFESKLSGYILADLPATDGTGLKIQGASTNDVDIRDMLVETNNEVVGGIHIHSSVGDNAENILISNTRVRALDSLMDYGIANEASKNPRLLNVEVTGATVADWLDCDFAVQYARDLTLQEITTPTAITDYGKCYTKTDNKLYFQDGAGSEHNVIESESARVIVECTGSNDGTKINTALSGISEGLVLCTGSDCQIDTLVTVAADKRLEFAHGLVVTPKTDIDMFKVLPNGSLVGLYADTSGVSWTKKVLEIDGTGQWMQNGRKTVIRDIVLWNGVTNGAAGGVGIYVHADTGHASDPELADYIAWLHVQNVYLDKYGTGIYFLAKGGENQYAPWVNACIFDTLTFIRCPYGIKAEGEMNSHTYPGSCGGNRWININYQADSDTERALWIEGNTSGNLLEGRISDVHDIPVGKYAVYFDEGYCETAIISPGGSNASDFEAKCNIGTGKGNQIISQGVYDQQPLHRGLIAETVGLKEITTPTAITDYGKVYTKSDNKIYFQDGAGVEHEIAFA